MGRRDKRFERRRTRCAPWLVAVLAAWLSSAGARAADVVVAETFSLNDRVREISGQRQGITVGSDGNCYFAGSTRSLLRGATFWRYEPAGKKLTLVLQDVTLSCGEDPSRTPAQGGVHTDVVEAGGWLYFGTHLADRSGPARDAYTGAHVLGFGMASRQVIDLGVVRPRHSIYAAVGADPARRRLYAFVTPFDRAAGQKDGAHLYRIEVDSAEKKDLGLVKEGAYHVCLRLFVDKRGDCWFSMRKDAGALLRARGDTGKIDRWENALPPLRSWKEGLPAPPDEQKDRYWLWAEALPDGERCVFTMHNGGGLWLFDPTRGVRSMFRLLKHIGPTGLGKDMAGGRVYYVQQAGRKRIPATAKRDLHLCSVAVEPGADPAIIDHGSIVDKRGRKPLLIPSLAADGKGRVFMVGAWSLLPGEEGSVKHTRKADGKGVREEEDSGQFFAVVDVSEDLKVARGGGRRP